MISQERKYPIDGMVHLVIFTQSRFIVQSNSCHAIALQSLTLRVPSAARKTYPHPLFRSLVDTSLTIARQHLGTST
jgi:hypothetical protein